MLVAVVSSPIPEPLVLAVLCAACCWSRRGGMLVAVVSSPIPEPLVLAVLCAACCWSRAGGGC